VMRHPKVLAILQQLVNPSIRFDTSKLNMKAAGYGAAVEWHQDWAFYPHTNDDLAAVGVMLDDCNEENGPLMVVPGSHTGTTYNHHADGRFCGAIDIGAEGIDLTRAVALRGRAGSISIHHARILHGSAPNRSGKPRRLLLNQYRAADAWPLLGVSDYDAYRAQLIAGSEPEMPRLVHVPIRLPLPPAERSGSIYENQKGLRSGYFREDRERVAEGVTDGGSDTDDRRAAGRRSATGRGSV
jgi:phytanoyl-CoA hydroxylase